eukprot:1160396-Pelagomonas_calceolata.AAC.14
MPVVPCPGLSGSWDCALSPSAALPAGLLLLAATLTAPGTVPSTLPPTTDAHAPWPVLPCTRAASAPAPVRWAPVAAASFAGLAAAAAVWLPVPCCSRWQHPDGDGLPPACGAPPPPPTAAAAVAAAAGPTSPTLREPLPPLPLSLGTASMPNGDKRGDTEGVPKVGLPRFAALRTSTALPAAHWGVLVITPPPLDA